MLSIVAVSYLNTKPLLYGLSHFFKSPYTLSTEIPRVCGEFLGAGKADMGLIPVAMLKELPDFVRISDFGITALGKVDSVSLFSQVPLQDIQTILLDYQSRTSIALTQILAKQHWNIQPKYEPAYPNYELDIQGTTAGVIIGDRAFLHKSKFLYEYDLAQAWFEYQQLPFVFAAWVIRKNLYTSSLHQEMNHCFQQGLTSCSSHFVTWAKESNLPLEVVNHYLTQAIRYSIGEAEEKALNLFLTLL